MITHREFLTQAAASQSKDTALRAMRSISALLLSAVLGPASATAQSIDLRDVWQGQPGAFAPAARAGAGFSFKYNSKSVGPEFGSDWRQAVATDPKSGVIKTTLTHESGLVVTREMRVFPDFNAVEYKVYFKNAAKRKLPPVSEIQALDLAFGESVFDGNCVMSSGGGFSAVEGFLPPRSFAIREHCFSSILEYPAVVALTAEDGVSSHKDLPFFFLHNEGRQEGLFVAFGWSGQWLAHALLDPAARTVTVSGKIPGVDIALEPGEEIPGPTVLVGLYQGALSEGSNRLRRLVREMYTPRLAGKKFQPLATYDHWYGGIHTNFDEALLRKLADGAAAIGQEYFLLDAGWFAGVKGEDFGAGLGNWYEVDRSRLPNGLKPVADYVRSKGLKFGLWFAPELVARGSRLAEEHPEWILWEYSKEYKSSGGWAGGNKDYGLLDYGRLDVQEWVREMLDHYIREYGVRYIRYDGVQAPLLYWDAYDEPDRRGVKQLRHIQGLYAVIDWLRARHPDVVLEGCSGGGRRIDLETARRFHTFWLSDYTADPAIIRFHLFGINHFLPGNYHYIQYTLPLPHQKDFQADDLGFQSMFGGAFGVGGRVDRWPEPMKRQARLHVETYKKLRRYLVEDYYPLSPQPADLESWSGWQFHDPNDQSGFVQTFRTKTPDTTHRFVLHKLDSKARYRFTDVYGVESFEMTGLAAMAKGVEITQAPMSSKVFTYRKIVQ